MSVGVIAVLLLLLLGVGVIVLVPRRPVLGMLLVVGLVLVLVGAFMFAEVRTVERERAAEAEAQRDAWRRATDVAVGLEIGGRDWPLSIGSGDLRLGDYRVVLPPVPEQVAAVGWPELRDGAADLHTKFTLTWEPTKHGTLEAPVQEDVFDAADAYMGRLLTEWLRQVRKRAPASLARVQSLLRDAPADAPERVVRRIMTGPVEKGGSYSSVEGEGGRFMTECDGHMRVPLDDLVLALKKVGMEGRSVTVSRRWPKSMLAGLGGLSIVVGAAVVLKASTRRARGHVR
ncbi:MAG: hypothetical protein PVJ57_00210 [Phycisphaerae bacterium]|jgi:hypothetical protein